MQQRVRGRTNTMQLRRRLWNPRLLVFLSNACIMVIELVASRLIAPRVGVSLYTWTSVIGVILAGISIGNYAGGRLADRRASPGLLGLVFCLSSLSSLAVIWLNNDLHDLTLPEGVPFMGWVMLYVAGVFGLPSVFLGCVSPIIVKLSLTDLERTGRTVGSIYAWSAVGSIVGTFATGFFLMAFLGTKTTIMAVSGLLMLIGLWFLSDAPRGRALLRVAVAAGLFVAGLFLLYRQGFLKAECMLETNYYCINVTERDRDGRPVRELMLDRLVHGYTDMEDPTYLGYDYEKTYAALIEPVSDANPRLDAFFIGGGNYTLPRYLETTLPESHVVVAEIDPGVSDAARYWLGLAEDTRIETHNLDARHFMAFQAQANSYDLVFGDAFNDFSVPFHLTTLEFNRLVERALRDDGLYLANIIDGGPYGRFLRAFVRTLREVFHHVVVIPSSPSWRDTVRNTFVIAAANRPIDLSNLPNDFPPLSAEDLAAYLLLEPSAILTDDFVPTDNLMAAVTNASFTGDAITPDMMARVVPRVAAVGSGLLVTLVAAIVWLLRRRARRRESL